MSLKWEGLGALIAGPRFHQAPLRVTKRSRPGSAFRDTVFSTVGSTCTEDDRILGKDKVMPSE